MLMTQLNVRRLMGTAQVDSALARLWSR